MEPTMSDLTDLGSEMYDPGKVRFPEDSGMWIELFTLAMVADAELFYRLHYIRGTGARLVKDPQFGFKIVPVVSDQGWESEAQYREEVRCLIPYQALLVRLLGQLPKEAPR